MDLNGIVYTFSSTWFIFFPILVDLISASSMSMSIGSSGLFSVCRGRGKHKKETGLTETVSSLNG